VRGKEITLSLEESYMQTPSALTFWTLGTGVLSGFATMILTRRAEKEGWSRVKTGVMVSSVVAASALNIILAGKIIKGE